MRMVENQAPEEGRGGIAFWCEGGQFHGDVGFARGRRKPRTRTKTGTEKKGSRDRAVQFGGPASATLACCPRHQAPAPTTISCGG